MNVDVEDRLAAALRDDAARFPDDGSLLGGVHDRVRRRSHRRLAGTAALGAAAVAVTGLTVTHFRADVASVVPRPGRVIAAQPHDDPLERGTALRVEFPLQPGWLPPGAETSPVVSLNDSGLSARYDGVGQPQFPRIVIWTADRDVSLPGGQGVQRRPTTVNGHAGTIATFGDTTALAWQTGPSAWIGVSGHNGAGEEEVVRRVAESLTERPLRMLLPFELDLAPRGSELAEWSTDGSLVFVPRGSTAAWRANHADPDHVRVVARRATADLTGRGESVTVRGRPGWLLTQDGGRRTLVVQITEEVCLVVDTPSWSRGDVLRLGEAVGYTGGTPPQEG